MTKAIVTINIRLSPEEHRELKEAADKACRSIQREIIYRLRQGRRNREIAKVDAGLNAAWFPLRSQ